ncbi:MAG TPA: hypothetical protein VGE39_25170 [Prosthecobacter sp.]
MPTFRLISLLVLLGLAVSGCTWVKSKTGGFLSGLMSKKAAKNNKKMGEVKVVGVVEMVNPEQNYVLINCEQRLNLAPGTEIIAQSADGTRVKLKVTPERKGNYITADIQEGVPQVRDLVVQQIKPGELPAANTMADPVSGPPVSLTPVMQADVIPPLDAPFQPIAPGRPSAPVMPSPAPPLAVPQAAPPPPAESEPEPDGTGLPPVIR